MIEAYNNSALTTKQQVKDLRKSTNLKTSGTAKSLGRKSGANSMVDTSAVLNVNSNTIDGSQNSPMVPNSAPDSVA